MTIKTENILNERDKPDNHRRVDLPIQLPLEVPWSNKEAKEQLEAQLRQLDLVGIASPDGSLTTMSRRDFTPNYVFTAKWNSATTIIPMGTYAGLSEETLPIDWSLTPNPKDRLSLTDIELHNDRKYAFEGETAIIATVTDEGGLQISQVGAYQDISDRDVSPAGKMWGTGHTAGFGPLWISISSWDELEGAQMNAGIVGYRENDTQGEGPRIISIPADINKLARHWREDLVRVLQEHVVYKDLNLEPGTRILFTTGQLYWDQDYEDRFYETNETPIVEATGTLTLKDGREVQSKTWAHTVNRPEAILTTSQYQAIDIWQDQIQHQSSTSSQIEVGSEEMREKYSKARLTQTPKNKLGSLVPPEAFIVGESPSPKDIKDRLPTIEELRKRYNQLTSNWVNGAGVELLTIRDGTSIQELKGELTGVIATPDGQLLDATIAKRHAQRSYDIGAYMWNKPAPDLAITSTSTTAKATFDIAMYGVGEIFPISQVQEDWRLNERSFGCGIGRLKSDFHTDQLYSFTNALEGGENFSYVHLKALSLLLDLFESANTFYKREHRPMRIALTTHEGPMQIIEAIMRNKQSLSDVFAPIDSTAISEIHMRTPFLWPSYIKDEDLQLK